MYSGQKTISSGSTSIIERYILKVRAHLKQQVEVPPQTTILPKSKISYKDLRRPLHQPSRNFLVDPVPQSLKEVRFLESPNLQDQSKVRFLLHLYPKGRQKPTNHHHPQPPDPLLNKSLWLHKQQIQLHKQVLQQQCHKLYDQWGHHPSHMMENEKMPQPFGMF